MRDRPPRGRLPGDGQRGGAGVRDGELRGGRRPVRPPRDARGGREAEGPRPPRRPGTRCAREPLSELFLADIPLHLAFFTVVIVTVNFIVNRKIR